MNDDNTAAAMVWYQGLIHAIPMLTNIADLALTDMALEKKHWWIAFLTMFPFYMITNWIGSMTVGGLNGKIGTIYGVEQWDSNVPLTIFIFFIVALIQAGLFWLAAAVVECLWPKRVSEILELNANLLEDEK